MDILRMILADRFSRGEMCIVLDQDAVNRLESDCIEVLARIRAVLADDSLDDPECFDRIERIVCEMESLGLDCGTRHDFG